MNLSSLPDPNLIEKTENLVRQERELLTNVLHHLREIDRRRLFSSLGYRSLFEFTVKHLGYPEDQAYRRIAAMRLLKELPEIEEKIEAGEISLTHIGLAQSLFKQEKKIQNHDLGRERKLAVFEQIAKKPVREAERITLSLSSAPELAKPDRVNRISEHHIELKFVASAELQQKIERLKGMLAHRHPNLALGELLEKLCDLGLKEWGPAQPKKAVAKAGARATVTTTTELVVKTMRKTTTETAARATAITTAKPIAKTIEKFAAPRKRCVKSAALLPLISLSQTSDAPVKSTLSTVMCAAKTFKQVKSHERPSCELRSQVQIRRHVFARANGCCENCGSSYVIEIDHIHPQAKGGSSRPENLRVLCRSCNQRSAIVHFGQKKMDMYINA